jgi:hypothetical protein
MEADVMDALRIVVAGSSRPTPRREFPRLTPPPGTSVQTKKVLLAGFLLLDFALRAQTPSADGARS